MYMPRDRSNAPLAKGNWRNRCIFNNSTFYWCLVSGLPKGNSWVQIVLTRNSTLQYGWNCCINFLFTLRLVLQVVPYELGICVTLAWRSTTLPGDLIISVIEYNISLLWRSCVCVCVCARGTTQLKLNVCGHERAVRVSLTSYSLWSKYFSRCNSLFCREVSSAVTCSTSTPRYKLCGELRPSLSKRHSESGEKYSESRARFWRKPILYHWIFEKNIFLIGPVDFEKQNSTHFVNTPFESASRNYE